MGHELAHVKNRDTLTMTVTATVAGAISALANFAFFFGGATRSGGQAGWIDFIPNCFSEIPSQIERGRIGADVVFSLASPMDADGNFALSLGADYTMAAVAKARAVVLEVNPHVPYAFGACHVHVSRVAAGRCGVVEGGA